MLEDALFVLGATALALAIGGLVVAFYGHTFGRLTRVRTRRGRPVTDDPSLIWFHRHRGDGLLAFAVGGAATLAVTVVTTFLGH